MRCKKRCHLIIAAMMFFLFFTLPVQAEEMTIRGPEAPALVISGNNITRGKGFLHNYVALIPSELNDIAASASGEATYRLGLGDCFTEAITYSTYEDHGTPAWIYRRVYGLDLKTMAEALGIDTGQVMSITVHADDGMSKTLSDAFGINTGRWSYDFTATRVNPVSPVLALYETTSEIQDPAEGVLPDLPVLGPDSTDRVDNVFGYGQTDFREITSCYWVKNVRRLRIGSETPALTIVDSEGSAVDLSLSTLISHGIWQAVIGQIKAQGVPLGQFLREFGFEVPAGYSLRAQSLDSCIDVSPDQFDEAFIAWQAANNGSAVNNSTSLQLYYGGGKVLADLSGMSVIPVEGNDVLPVFDPGFSDLENYSWAVDSISDLFQRGVIKGLGNNTYGPALDIRRGDFMLMLARAYDLKASADGNFLDVPAGTYYYDAIATARALGIARGDGEFFKPDSSITRQEAFTLLHRTLALVGYELPAGDSTLSSFKDNELVALWAREPVGSLVTSGIIQGNDNFVNPLGMLTRAEMAVIMKRALDLQ